MRTQSKHKSQGCPEWTDQITGLLELAPDDEVRLVWARHAEQCPACREVFEQENLVRWGVEALADPGRALIANRVLNRIRGQQTGMSVFRPRDLGWGILGSLTGVALGFWFALSLSPETGTTAVTYYEQLITNLEQGPDAVVSELLTDLEDGS